MQTKIKMWRNQKAIPNPKKKKKKKKKKKRSGKKTKLTIRYLY